MFFLHTIKLQPAFWMPENDSAPWLHHTIIPGFTLYNFNCLSCSLNREISGLFYILCMIKLSEYLQFSIEEEYSQINEPMPIFTALKLCLSIPSDVTVHVHPAITFYFLVHFTFLMFFSPIPTFFRHTAAIKYGFVKFANHFILFFVCCNTVIMQPRHDSTHAL